MALGRLHIIQGPSFYNTLLRSLGDGEPVSFLIPPQDMGRLLIDGAPISRFEARLFHVHRIDLGASPGRTHDYFLKGEVLCPSGSGQRVGLRFSGAYNTHDRRGDFEFEERPYEGGDLIRSVPILESGAVHVPMRIEIVPIRQVREG